MAGASTVAAAATSAVSDLTGLNSERLYLKLKLTALEQLIGSQNLIPTIGIDGVLALSSFVDAMCKAVAQEVVAEIQGHSNLMAITRDAGPAGAGIITGFVK